MKTVCRLMWMQEEAGYCNSPVGNTSLGKVVIWTGRMRKELVRCCYCENEILQSHCVGFREGTRQQNNTNAKL